LISQQHQIYCYGRNCSAGGEKGVTVATAFVTTSTTQDKPDKTLDLYLSKKKTLDLQTINVGVLVSLKGSVHKCE
jgi:hypothetical protein